VRATKRKFDFLDIILILGMILPLVAAIMLKVLFTPETHGVSITGALIFWQTDTPIGKLMITESIVNSWAIVMLISCLAVFLTRKLSVKNPSTRQAFAEWIVYHCEKLVGGNMREEFANYGPFIAAILSLSAFSSLSSLLGLHSPTSNINIVAAWASLVFVLITYYKLKLGPIYYIKGFAEPVVILFPINVISEFATPVSMTFRHYGNILSGSIIGTLIAYALGLLSNKIFGFLPGLLGDIPYLRVGLPAILSLYFDVFSACMQAFIFAMLTMSNVSGALPEGYIPKIRKKHRAKQQIVN